MKKFRITFFITGYSEYFKFPEVIASSEKDACDLAFKEVMGAGSFYYVVDIQRVE